MRKAIVGLLSLLILSACSEGVSDYPPPSLAPEEVLSAAGQFLEEQEVDVAEYRLESLGFDYVKRSWQLRYEGNSGVLHDYYWLAVEDDNIDEISVSGR